MRLHIDRVDLEIDGTLIVSDADIEVGDGEVAALVGPNGSGKSTLLRAVYRHLAPAGGRVVVGDLDVWDAAPRTVARRVAAVPQERDSGDFELTVAEVVGMGRTPHHAAFSRDGPHDRRVIAEALARVDTAGLAHRRFSTLSGGERQRVLLARALAQEPSVLVLDEPTNHLDVRHQMALLALLREVGQTTLLALHDLNLAVSYCDRVHVLRDGRVYHAGAPRDVLTPQVLAEVFGVDGVMITHPITGAPLIAFAPHDARSQELTPSDRATPR